MAQALRRVESILKENKINIKDYTDVSLVPIHVKMLLVEDLLKHLDNTGIGFPVYGKSSVRAKVQNLIAQYGQTINSDSVGWLKFIRDANALAVLILNEYRKNREGL